MRKPCVIAINAVSGGGKTALAKLLAASLPNAVLFCFDDFDDTNVYPADYFDWVKRGGDLSEFDCPGLVAAVEQTVNRCASDYIVLDYPFGRTHPRLNGWIDLSVYVDTPLDVALARRILRESAVSSQVPAEERWLKLRSELSDYIERARLPFENHRRHIDSSDLVLDGCTCLESLRDLILARIRTHPSTVGESAKV